MQSDPPRLTPATARALTVYGLVSGCAIVAVVLLGARWFLDDVPPLLTLPIFVVSVGVLTLAAGYIGWRRYLRDEGGSDAA